MTHHWTIFYDGRVRVQSSPGHMNDIYSTPGALWRSLKKRKWTTASLKLDGAQFCLVKPTPGGFSIYLFPTLAAATRASTTHG